LSRSRPDLDPPRLEGYTVLDRLGRGGFSDVFLYEREFPRQKVAVKVLVIDDVDEVGRERFTAEANTMASLSEHPFIVKLLEAAISPEGHPYLVMEYYPGPNFSARAKADPFSVATALQVGVQVASAVETAHQNGVLHRDIKPANVLTSKYGRPGLTDFGIAVTGDARRSEAEGMSIPWSPPEVVSGSGIGNERSDVYSLAATVYTLLAGRSPFEVPGGQNRSIDLIDRINRSPVPTIDRQDVPSSLQRVLSRAMSKDPSHRHGSAAEFARDLQAIEVEQRLAITPLEILQDDGSARGPAPGEPLDVDAGATNLKRPGVIEAQRAAEAPTPTQSRRVSDTTTTQNGYTGTFVRPPGGAPPRGPVVPAQIIAATPYHRTTAPSAPPASPPAASGAAAQYAAPASKHYTAPQPEAAPPLWRRPPVLLGILGALVVIGGLVALGSTVLSGDPPPTTTPGTARVEAVDVAPQAANPEFFRVVWQPVDPRPGDVYRIRSRTGSDVPDVPFPEVTANIALERENDCVTVTPIRDGVGGTPGRSAGCSTGP
jgi:eukaryotic-like serine/threonine-protein kinase